MGALQYEDQYCHSYTDWSRLHFDRRNCRSGLAQWGAAKLEDRRARTEIVLELMRANDREETLEKLRILNASGLLPDEDGRLIGAITKAPKVAFRIERVKIPVAVRCARAEDIPSELPPLGERPEDTGQAVRKLAIRALELQNQNDLMRATLLACIDGLPAYEDLQKNGSKINN